MSMLGCDWQLVGGCWHMAFCGALTICLWPAMDQPGRVQWTRPLPPLRVACGRPWQRALSCGQMKAP